MPQARSKQVSLELTPYYHCVSRCVRRAFLCGEDALTGKSFEHRRGWLEAKLLEVSRCFMIDIASYAIMSNHYHLVLCVDNDGAEKLTAREVISRWHQLFKGNHLSKAYIAGETLDLIESDSLNTYVEVWRKRLADISWFMRSVNEYMARLANQEDDCTGRFWEGRFKSQALLDEKALLACMAYVDLNPIRANMANSLNESRFTSIQKRLAMDQTMSNQGDKYYESELFSFEKVRSDNSANNNRCLPFSYSDYLALLEWTVDGIRKSQSFNDSKPRLLNELAFEQDSWFYVSQNFESRFKTLVGGILNLKKACSYFCFKRVVGSTACRSLIDT